MRHTATMALAGAILMAGALPANALTIDTTGFGADNPEGITFDPVSGNLFVIGNDSDSNGFVWEITTAGTFVSSFATGLGTDGEGISYDHVTGNLLVTNSLSAGSGGGVYQFSKTGTNLGLFATIDPPSGDPDGIVVHPTTGNLWIADDSDESLYEFARTGGAPLTTIVTDAILSQFDEPEGITYDAVTGHLFVADDSSGSGRVYEMTTGGTIIRSFVIPGFGDPEGVTIDPTTRILYVVDDQGSAINTIQLRDVSEPAVLGLLALGLAGIGVSRRRKRN